MTVTAWLAHTPPEILAENFGVPVGAFSKIPLHNLWIFQGKLPAALATDQKAVEEPGGLPPSPNVDEATIAKFPKDRPLVIPK
jgi:oxalate decarboxylase